MPDKNTIDDPINLVFKKTCSDSLKPVVKI